VVVSQQSKCTWICHSWYTERDRVMSTHVSVFVDSVGPPSAEIYRTAISFP
jgi:hypothetical protein